MGPLRPASRADIPEMCRTVALGLESFRAWAPQDWSPGPEVSAPATLERRWSTPGFAAWVNEDVTAHTALGPAEDEPATFHLMHLFVRPELHGTGVATELLARAVEHARDEGGTGMRLRTPLGNARGIRFYEREGWHRHGEPLDAGSAIGLPHTWMRRDL